MLRLLAAFAALVVRAGDDFDEAGVAPEVMASITVKTISMMPNITLPFFSKQAKECLRTSLKR